MDFNKSLIVINEEIDLYIIDLSKYNQHSIHYALKSIPNNQPGIYAWYRNYNYQNKSDYKEELLNDIVKPKFQTRKGAINPYYEVEISSNSTFSVNKLKRYNDLLKNREFSETMSELLKFSIFFQSPLYIGKSSNLRKRISSHLDFDSPLRERLKNAEIEINECKLLILENSKIKEDFQEQEDIIEEILSRLFNPLFSIRIG